MTFLAEEQNAMNLPAPLLLLLLLGPVNDISIVATKFAWGHVTQK